MRTIYYCLNGIGYFGSRSLRTAVELRPLLPPLKPPARLEIFCLADPDSGRLKRALDALQSLDIDIKKIKLRPNAEGVLAEVRRRIEAGVEPDDLFLVHDCSPTQLHHRNLKDFEEMLVARPGLARQVRYLVEKPAHTSVDFVRHERELGAAIKLPESAYCDYIELRSQTYLQAEEWLRDNSGWFKPTSLHVWRNSGTGFKKVFGRTRLGITGGALEDKAAHDLALTIGLLGDPATKPVVRRAKIENYMLGDWEGIVASDRPSFATVGGLTTEVLDRRYAPANAFDARSRRCARRRGISVRELLAFDIADARIRATVDWPLPDDRTVKCHYCFSWDGIDPDLKRRMLRTPLPGDLEWRGSEPHFFTGFGGREEYRVEEARIQILQDAQGRQLILNYLTKFDGMGAWILFRSDRETVEEIPIETRIGGDGSLVRIFLAVMEDREPRLGVAATSLIERVATDIRAFATGSKAPDERDQIRETTGLFKERSLLRIEPATAGVVFALDNVLIKTSELPRRVIEPVLQKIVGRRKKIDSGWIESLAEALKRLPFDAIAERFGLSESQLNAASEAMRGLRIPDDVDVEIHEDAERLLHRLAAADADRKIPYCVLTRGLQEWQKAKIDRSGLLKNKYLAEAQIHYDDIRDGPGRPTQRDWLASITSQWENCPAGRVLVVSALPGHLLTAGVDLGMDTVWLNRFGDAGKSNVPTHRVMRTLRGVETILFGAERLTPDAQGPAVQKERADLVSPKVHAAARLRR